MFGFLVLLIWCFLHRAVYVRRKCGHKQLRSDIYLSEAEPFLEQYAKRSPANQALIGAAGNLVRSEDFMAIVGAIDEEGDLGREREMESTTTSPSTKEAVKKQGLIVFFPGVVPLLYIFYVMPYNLGTSFEDT